MGFKRGFPSRGEYYLREAFPGVVEWRGGGLSIVHYKPYGTIGLFKLSFSSAERILRGIPGVYNF